MKLYNITMTERNAHISEPMEKEYKRLSMLSAEDLLKEKAVTLDGLTSEEAAERLLKNGKNTTTDSKTIPWYIFFLKSFVNEFIILLLILAIASFFLQDPAGAGIIILLALISVIIRFKQDYSAYIDSVRLKQMLHSTADVKRDGNIIKVNLEDIVDGDLVMLSTGAIVPADIVIIESYDLFVSQSVFTGESEPVEKMNKPGDDGMNSTGIQNIVLMGCNVVSGSGTGVVVITGKSTYLGHISETAENVKGKTNFEKGISKISNMLVRYMIIIVLMVFFINGFIKKDWIEALLFAVSVAVGLTPGMLPMIVNASLAKGATALAKKKTIVKTLGSIQNLGAMDVLCTDKTGTLTMDNIVLQRYIDIEGKDDIEILEFAFMNAFFSTGIKNLIDHAIISYGREHGLDKFSSGYVKVDEIPFDFERKRMSVVIQDKGNDNNYRIITKGALEEIASICTTARINNEICPMTDEITKRIYEHADSLSNDGMHVIAIAEKQDYAGKDIFEFEHECDMTFIGYVVFLDPPKPDAAVAIKKLYDAGVEIKVLTGDSPVVAGYICNKVGMKDVGVLTGMEIADIPDDELSKLIEKNNIFARLAPMQKQRIVMLLKKNGHVTGYLGDGVNDAPSLRAADVGISVDTATDIAKESSDIILLEKSLSVINDGVYEGRRIYGNIMKYIKMILSSNLGNVTSVLVASIFLSFLPMLPIQILIQNLLYDASQTAIPWDNVDEEFLKGPKKWNIKGVSNFMNVFGSVSSVYDIITFIMLWFVLGYNSIDRQALFQTGWFLEGLMSQILVIHFIRTSKLAIIKSRADIRLTFATIVVVIMGFLTPFLFRNIKDFHYETMHPEYYIFLSVILMCYLATVEAVKHIYIRMNKD